MSQDDIEQYRKDMESIASVVNNPFGVIETLKQVDDLLTEALILIRSLTNKEKENG